jgi:hypothetical protein
MHYLIAPKSVVNLSFLVETDGALRIVIGSSGIRSNNGRLYITTRMMRLRVL